MVSIVFRYIFRKLCCSFFVVSPIVILMAWVTMSMRFVKLIVSDNITIPTFFRLASCIFPEVSAIILPVCFLISSIIAIQSLQSNKEMIVLLTSGKSPISILRPLLLLSMGVSFLVFILQAVLSPYAYKTFDNLEETIKTQISISFLKPLTFNVIGESIIYVEEASGTELKNIFVSYIPKDKHSCANIIIAKSGKYIYNGPDEIFIQLYNGYRQEFEEDNRLKTTLKFESISYDISPFFKRFYSKSRKTSAKTQSELLYDSRNSTDESLRKRYISEYHSRIISSFTPIWYALVLAIFLIVPQERGRGRKESFQAFLVGVVIQALTMTMLNASIKDVDMIKCNYIAVLSVTGILLIMFCKKRN